ncbi:MAG TPA: glycosyltransferase family A protein [Allosphingosinicella sp.]|nr:glycosyltransferase family A protein [Allosphingosinicella sp.]
MTILPALSVILPVHDGMPYVEESIRSILQQSFGDLELVIGDDGSSDGTSEVLARLAAEDRRIRVLRRERPSGLAASANWVVSQTRAPLVAVAHADDRAYPERLERQIAVLRGEPEIDLVGTLWDGMDEEGRRVRPGDFWRLLRRSPFAPFSHSSIMFRRAAFERAGGYRPEAEYWEDLDLYFRVAERGRIVVIPEVLSTVRHARISTRLRNNQLRVENAVDLMFRSTACYAAGGDHTPLLKSHAPLCDKKLHPMTFISCGSTRLWSGRSPRIIERMRERALLKFNGSSLHALVWVLWGTASPRTLRLFLRSLLHIRNAIAKPLLRGRDYVEWCPREAAAGARASAARPAARAGRG